MKWQPILVLLPEKSHGQRSLEGYSPRSCKRTGHDWMSKQHTVICANLTHKASEHSHCLQQLCIVWLPDLHLLLRLHSLFFKSSEIMCRQGRAVGLKPSTLSSQSHWRVYLWWRRPSSPGCYQDGGISHWLGQTVQVERPPWWAESLWFWLWILAKNLNHFNGCNHCAFWRAARIQLCPAVLHLRAASYY